MNYEIVQEAETWLGVKYQHRSCSKFGCDCTGLIVGVMKSLGHIKDYTLRNYPKDWNMHAMADNHIEEEISKFADKVSKPVQGDIVLFKFKHQKFVAHIGILLEDGLFIHSWEKAGRVQISSMSRWKSHVDSYYRFNEDKVK